LLNQNSFTSQALLKKNIQNLAPKTETLILKKGEMDPEAL
jgi:hypothetical protein